MTLLVCPLGSCRVHRPLKKRVNGEVFDNVKTGVSVVYPKLGFFHSPFEVRQALELLSGRKSIPPAFLRLCFRRENPSTTPDNEFLPALATAAMAQEPIDLRASWFENVNVFLIEISSLTVNLHGATGLYLISNPNLYRDGVSYSEIYPAGFYAKYAPDMAVEKFEMVLDDVVACFRDIQSIVQGRPVVYLNHPDKPSATRKRVNAVVSEAAIAAGSRFFDTEHIVRRFCFLTDMKGQEDIHHLSHEGEAMLGTELQALCSSLK
jgi:hypothetical protein